jgi:UDP-N-acetylglucosamine 2-epimerase (non-hydrolysing)
MGNKMATTSLPIKSKICIILGTRPEIIKLSPIIRLLVKLKKSFIIIHSNQHYSALMDKIFFQQLNLPSPNYNLGLVNRPRSKMISEIVKKCLPILKKENITQVMVQGDTNTVLAGAKAAKKLKLKIIHVEAGLRSNDLSMPEEINRIETDKISDFLFTPTSTQKEFLIKEGIDSKKIFVVGNTIVDAVLQNLKLIKKINLSDYFLLTLHRPANVDHPRRLKQIIKSLEKVSSTFNLPIIFPIHPRTKQNLEKYKINLNPSVFIIKEPLGYLEMLSLEKNAKLIFTDSGGIQEEACILKTPCVTIRDNTERPETIQVGANVLSRPEDLSFHTNQMISKTAFWLNPFGSGNTSDKILKLLKILLALKNT